MEPEAQRTTQITATASPIYFSPELLEILKAYTKLSPDTVYAIWFASGCPTDEMFERGE